MKDFTSTRIDCQESRRGTFAGPIPDDPQQFLVAHLFNARKPTLTVPCHDGVTTAHHWTLLEAAPQSPGGLSFAVRRYTAETETRSRSLALFLFSPKLDPDFVRGYRRWAVWPYP
jgi:hypothetical protein